MNLVQLLVIFERIVSGKVQGNALDNTILMTFFFAKDDCILYFIIRIWQYWFKPGNINLHTIGANYKGPEPTGIPQKDSGGPGPHKKKWVVQLK